MLETDFIFRQQKIEFKPMSGMIMLLCNRMFCCIFGCCLPPLFCFLPLSQTVRLPRKKLQNATKWLNHLLVAMFMDKAKTFWDHSMILWEMATNGQNLPPLPAYFRVKRLVRGELVEFWFDLNKNHILFVLILWREMSTNYWEFLFQIISQPNLSYMTLAIKNSCKLKYQDIICAL